ncbi:MAG: isochorismatase family protein [Bacteroidales bacterium]|jgi:nicotinamidase-related amidase|nr:isochorismatase family protein [Bacteroidales bacterium]
MIKKILLIGFIYLYITQIYAADIKIKATVIDEHGQETRKDILIDASRTAIIVIDMWNGHWCMTASQRVSAMVPRMNRVLNAARDLGMLVVWNPSDVVALYAGMPQYEAVAALPLLLPVDARPPLPQGQFVAPVGACLCGPGVTCTGNYGWDAMHPDLHIAPQDRFSASSPEIYTLLKSRDIIHVIYMGVHTNMCVFGKPGALSDMYKAGFNCYLAEDLNDAFTCYDPDRHYTPDDGTADIDRQLAHWNVPVFNMGEALKIAGLWDSTSPVDLVRFSPWGTPDRPYLMQQPTVLTLTSPWIEQAEIRYTTDGSAPSAHSSLYTHPLVIEHTTLVRATAFRNGKEASIPSRAQFVLLPPPTPLPDIFLDDLNFKINPYAISLPDCAWIPVVKKSYEHKKLRVGGEIYSHGLGFRAPSSVIYDLLPEYKRFVAAVGCDENMLDIDNGRAVASRCNVIFKVFVDGVLVAESPVMHVSTKTWNFNVEIPEGSKKISIACTTIGTPDRVDLGNWVNAGFLTR